VPQLFTPVRSLAEVQGLDAGKLNTATLNRVCHKLGTGCVMVFTFETERPESTVHVRMFAPLLGVPEDPATGGANGALGAYLVHHQAIPVAEPTTYIVSEQGAEISRPSTLYVEVDSKGDEITAVRVGGQVMLVAEGVVQLLAGHRDPLQLIMLTIRQITSRICFGTVFGTLSRTILERLSGICEQR
jgi:trans-2,3-dihydro-3-hydroxyanthranilate isomerase